MPVVFVEGPESSGLPKTELLGHEALVAEYAALQERYERLQEEHSLTVAELQHIRAEQTGMIAMNSLRDAKRAVHSRRLKITGTLLTVGLGMMGLGVIVAGTRTMGVALFQWHDMRTVKAAQPYWLCSICGLALMLLAVLPTDTYAVRAVCTVLGVYGAVVASTFCVLRVVLVLRWDPWLALALATSDTD